MLLDVTKLRLRSVLKFKIRVLVFVLKTFGPVKLFNKSETIYRRSKNCSDRRAKKLIMAKLVRTIPLFFFAKFQYWKLENKTNYLHFIDWRRRH